MAEAKEYPKVVLKRKNIQTIVDFCLDESLPFSVKPQQFPDTDWEVEIQVDDVQMAIVVGMFLRDSKLELAGVQPDRYKKTTTQRKSKTSGTSSSSSSSSSSGNGNGAAKNEEAKETTEVKTEESPNEEISNENDVFNEQDPGKSNSLNF